MAQPIAPLSRAASPSTRQPGSLDLLGPIRAPELALSSSPALEALWKSFIAVSPAMTGVLREVLLRAPSRKPLILVGATGTGKTTIAELVHAASGRPGELFAHTVGSLDPNLERSELFGHERGAFTGANTRRIGWIEEAGPSTLLLDDCHHLRRGTQVLLLRALDRRVFRRLGGMRELTVLCRVIVGLGDEAVGPDGRGRLLAEFMYRLGFAVVRIPPLVERREDIVPLADFFLRQAPEATGLTDGPTRFAAEVLPLLEAGSYPGNVRELRQIVEDAYERARGEETIREEHLPPHVRGPLVYRRWGKREDNERALVWALWRTGGDVGETAALLGVHRNTVSRVKRRLGR